MPSSKLELYVRSSGTGIAPLTRALTGLGESLGFEVRTRVTEHPKVYWRATSIEDTPIRIKIEVNTHERSPALPVIHVEHRVDSAWWTGIGSVQTFQPAELVATKIRALYQRSKGRDRFDLWLALEHLHLDPDEILGAFGWAVHRIWSTDWFRRGDDEVAKLRARIEQELAIDPDALAAAAETESEPGPRPAAAPGRSPCRR